MNMIASFSSVKAVAELAGLENIIMVDGENNGYDDSDFFYVGFNARTGDFFKHYHSTTRASGFRDLDNSVMVNALSESAQEQAREYFKAACFKEANRLMNVFYDNVISVGDTVTVTNTKARKFKGETFTVTDTSVWNDQYGRSMTKYLHGANGVKTNTLNCTRVSVGAAVLNKVAERLAVGLAIKF